MENRTIGFIGYGNMATAIVSGLLAKKVFTSENIFCCAKNYEKLLHNVKKNNINPCINISELIEKSDIIVIAVKPYQVENILMKYHDCLLNKLIISVAYGCNYNFLSNLQLKDLNYINVIPNTPICIGDGIILSELQNTLSGEQLVLYNKIFSKIAEICWLESSQINIATAIAGCSPAFVSMFIESLADAGVYYGLSKQDSIRIASKMLQGTASMQLITKKEPSELKSEVCSPKGTTIKGVVSLENNKFRASIINAIKAVMEN